MSEEHREYEKYQVYITQSAENDLDEIITYIAQKDPQNALKILERIREKIKMLEE